MLWSLYTKERTLWTKQNAVNRANICRCIDSTLLLSLHTFENGHVMSMKHLNHAARQSFRLFTLYWNSQYYHSRIAQCKLDLPTEYNSHSPMPSDFNQKLFLSSMIFSIAFVSLTLLQFVFGDTTPLIIEQWNAINAVLAASKCDKSICGQIGPDRICPNFDQNRLTCTNGYVTRFVVDDYRGKSNAFIATQIGLLTRLTFLEMFDSSMTGVRILRDWLWLNCNENTFTISIYAFFRRQSQRKSVV